MSYYKDNAKDYISKTINVNMEDSYAFFLKYAKPKTKLIDIGFGSGRDMIYFKSIGFDVYGIDTEYKFVEEAQKKGLSVSCSDIIIDFSDSFDVYDCIWACASLHHIPKELLNLTFKICSNILKTGGIMYCSFKYGDFVGFLHGRYFHFMTEKTIVNYIKDTNLTIIDVKITNDNLNRDTKWLNVILRKGE